MKKTVLEFDLRKIAQSNPFGLSIEGREEPQIASAMAMKARFHIEEAFRRHFSGFGQSNHGSNDFEQVTFESGRRRLHVLFTQGVSERFPKMGLRVTASGIPSAHPFFEDLRKFRREWERT